MNAETPHKSTKIQSILKQDWNPIGLEYEPANEDEYDLYIPTIQAMLKQNCSLENLILHLMQIEQNEMGLTPDHSRAKRVAERLLRLHSPHVL